MQETLKRRPEKEVLPFYELHDMTIWGHPVAWLQIGHQSLEVLSRGNCSWPYVPVPITTLRFMMVFALSGEQGFWETAEKQLVIGGCFFSSSLLYCNGCWLLWCFLRLMSMIPCQKLAAQPTLCPRVANLVWPARPSQQVPRGEEGKGRSSIHSD